MRFYRTKTQFVFGKPFRIEIVGKLSKKAFSYLGLAKKYLYQERGKIWELYKKLDNPLEISSRFYQLPDISFDIRIQPFRDIIILRPSGEQEEYIFLYFSFGIQTFKLKKFNLIKVDKRLPQESFLFTESACIPSCVTISNPEYNKHYISLNPVYTPYLDYCELWGRRSLRNYHLGMHNFIPFRPSGDTNEKLLYGDFTPAFITDREKTQNLVIREFNIWGLNIPAYFKLYPELPFKDSFPYVANSPRKWYILNSDGSIEWLFTWFINPSYFTAIGEKIPEWWDVKENEYRLYYMDTPTGKFKDYTQKYPREGKTTSEYHRIDIKTNTTETVSSGGYVLEERRITTTPVIEYTSDSRTDPYYPRLIQFVDREPIYLISNASYRSTLDIGDKIKTIQGSSFSRSFEGVVYMYGKYYKWYLEYTTEANGTYVSTKYSRDFTIDTSLVIGNREIDKFEYTQEDTGDSVDDSGWPKWVYYSGSGLYKKVSVFVGSTEQLPIEDYSSYSEEPTEFKLTAHSRGKGTFFERDIDYDYISGKPIYALIYEYSEIDYNSSDTTICNSDTGERTIHNEYNETTKRHARLFVNIGEYSELIEIPLRGQREIVSNTTIKEKDGKIIDESSVFSHTDTMERIHNSSITITDKYILYTCMVGLVERDKDIKDKEVYKWVRGRRIIGVINISDKDFPVGYHKQWIIDNNNDTEYFDETFIPKDDKKTKRDDYKANNYRKPASIGLYRF